MTDKKEVPTESIEEWTRRTGQTPQQVPTGASGVKLHKRQRLDFSKTVSQHYSSDKQNCRSCGEKE